MDEEENTTKPAPIPLAAMGRSGTFIIESADREQPREESTHASQSPDQATRNENNGESQGVSTKENPSDDIVVSYHVSNNQSQSPDQATRNENNGVSQGVSTKENPSDDIVVSYHVSNNQTSLDNAASVEQLEERDKDAETPTTMERPCSEDVSPETKISLVPDDTKSAPESGSEEASPKKTITPPSPPSPSPVRPLLPHPVPAPRKTMSNPREDTVCKYSALREKLKDRWNSIENAPKFQSIDSRMRKSLEDQVAKRLESSLSLQPEDLMSLQNKVQEALQRFYNQDQQQSPTMISKVEQTQGLPSLSFLQWMLPALDNRSIDLFLDCDIAKEKG